ncbi:hypothetical protein L3X38_037785 [Prunus dulcis]|uniref:Uncharacterized protein n=1 Tax=Prunus dulcis TaxID=3755 RepID=A0AAD4V658_PRUDU|nr:hypothetical protein L3X38_037785 [Prunus dulcis]
MAKIDDSTNGGDDEGNPSAEVTKTTIQSARFEIEKVNETNNFAMWQCEKLWTMLETKYLKKRTENHLHLKSNLYRFQYKDGTKMIRHLEDFNKL